jgi:hypothetical protein
VSLRDVVLTRLQEIPEVHSTQTVLIFEEATPVRSPRTTPRANRRPPPVPDPPTS